MKKLLTRSLQLASLLVLSGLATSCEDSEYPLKGAMPPSVATDNSQMEMWLTTSDKATLFQKQNVVLNFKEAVNGLPTITVDTTQTYQTMDGFGYTLTSGSAYVISRMSATERTTLLQELFGTDGTNIGVSYLRLNIGASDLSPSVYSYNDVTTGQTDPTLASFSLAPDNAYYLPVLKDILKVNPNIKLLGTPWSPPAWMKTNNSPKGGSLKPEYYEAYAQYLVKYLQAMKTEGITLDAITLQNEPLHDGNNPSMYMTAADQASFIKNNIGQALKAAGLTTKIIIYDHNLDRTDYPLAILADAEANKFVDGSAFHLYAGDINAMSQVHSAYPTKNVYFTEQYTGTGGNFGGDLSWHMKNVIIGATRNWSKNALEWNLAADANNGPYTDGGCNTCLPAVTVNSGVARNVAYYIIAHAAKFVRPGSIRINSNITSSLQNVAFKTTDGKKVLIVLNESNNDQTFNISFRNKVVTTTLKGGAVGTYVW